MYRQRTLKLGVYVCMYVCIDLCCVVKDSPHHLLHMAFRGQLRRTIDLRFVEGRALASFPSRRQLRRAIMPSLGGACCARRGHTSQLDTAVSREGSPSSSASFVLDVLLIR